MACIASETNLPAYMLEHFEKIAKQEGFIEYTIEIPQSDIANGSGFIAEMLPVQIIGNRFKETDDLVVNNNENNKSVKKSDRLKLMCKLLPKSEIRQKQFSSAKLFEREVYFYSKVLPTLKEFQLENGLTVDDQAYFNAIPHCYVAEYEPLLNKHIIIMADLREKNYYIWDKTKPIEYEHVRLLMEALGRFHALSIALRDQRPHVFAEFRKTLDDSMLFMAKQESFKKIYESSLTLAISVIDDPYYLRLIEKLQRTWPTVWNDCLGPDKAEPFSVIGHGDCWNNNILFADDENNSAKSIILLDWQMCRSGSPVLDMVHFFFSSIEKPLRDKHLNDLIHSYYDALCDTVRKCGSNPDKLFSFSDLENQLKKFSGFSWAFAPIMLGIMVSTADNIADMDIYTAELLATGNAGDFVTLTDSSRIDFITRLCNVIDDGVKYGWIDDSV